MWLRQMAQLSTTMSHAHSATAFHWKVLVKCPGDGWLSCVAYLLDLEALLVTFSAGTSLGRLRLGRGRVCHVNVGHNYMVVSEWWWGVCAGGLVSLGARARAESRWWRWAGRGRLN